MKATIIILLLTAGIFVIPFCQVLAQSLRGDIDTKCKNLTFSDLNLAPGDFGDDAKVLGRVMNNSTQILETVIVAEFYDRNGRLADVNEKSPSIGNLGPGDSSPFEIQSSGVGVNEVGNVTLTCGAVIPQFPNNATLFPPI